MELSRNKNKLVLEFDSEEDAEMVQKALDLYNYKRIIRKSKGTEKDIEELSNEIERDWWEENKHRFIK